MSASQNIDRYLKDLRIMQQYAQATADLETCKAQLATALATRRDYVTIKRERDELRELKFDAETIAYCMISIAMDHQVEKGIFLLPPTRHPIKCSQLSPESEACYKTG